MFEDITYKYKALNASEKLIVINVLVYIITALIAFFFGFGNFFELWLGVPNSLEAFFVRPYTLITYMFMHGGLMHLFFNMFMLYFVGKLFLNFFSGKQLTAVYILGGLAGGILYFIAYNLFPVFSSLQYSYLVGASASVMAILVGICAYIPNQDVRLFVFNVKLWHVGLGLVLLDLFQIPMSNSGGHIAHLGGALFGFLFAKQYLKGNDLTRGLNGLLSAVTNIFKSSRGSSTKFKKVYKNKTSSNTHSSTKIFDNDKTLHQKRIDAILEKISKSGYDSLTKEEKDYLFKSNQ